MVFVGARRLDYADIICLQLKVLAEQRGIQYVVSTRRTKEESLSKSK